MVNIEKVKAEIERRIINGQDGYGGNLKALLPFITSLQQEQPENEEKIMNFFDALGDCGFSQHDILLLKNIWKEAGCPPLKSQVKMEQPEVDLEKEIDNWLDAEPHTVRDTAIHFYELGLNARKEK